MTGTVDLSALHPARRADLLLAGPLWRGPAVVHLVRDPVAGRTYELGPKEYFVLSALDGERTLGEIGDAYAARFRTRLGDAHWTRLLGLFGTRRLLAGGPPPTPVPAERPRSTFLNGRTTIVADAGALTDRLHRATRALWRPLPLSLLAAAVLAMLGMMAADAGRLADGTRELYADQPVTLTAVGAVLWLSLAFHELAHGVAGRAYGAAVSEIGLRWRLPFVYTYCSVDDVPLLPRRHQQVVIAVAGAAANLLFLLPFAVVWLVLPDQAQARPAFAGILVLGVAIAVANLVPLPPLDGYKIVGYLARVDRLAAGSRGFLLARDRGAYPRRLRWVYGTYGVFVPAVSVALIAVVSVALARRWGTAGGFLPVAVLAAALVLWGVGLLARRRRSAEVVA